MADIYNLIPRVTASIPAIGKERRMTGGSGGTYNYRGVDDILPHVRAACAALNVTMTSAFEQVSDGTYAVRSGAEWRRVVLRGTFTFAAPDGSHVSTVTYGEGTDSADKAHNKAMTAALKYALIHTFLIADYSDDPDDHAPPGPLPALPPGRMTVADAKNRFVAHFGRDGAPEAWGQFDPTITDGTVAVDLVDAYLSAATTADAHLSAVTTAQEVDVSAIARVEGAP